MFLLFVRVRERWGLLGLLENLIFLILYCFMGKDCFIKFFGSIVLLSLKLIVDWWVLGWMWILLLLLFLFRCIKSLLLVICKYCWLVLGGLVVFKFWVGREDLLGLGLGVLLLLVGVNFGVGNFIIYWVGVMFWILICWGLMV